MPTRLATLLLIACSLVAGCAADNTPYDADWGESPFAGGKADGLLDIVPAIAFGDAQTGTVGGDDFDLYKIELLRTDRIELTMTVESGDLNPHLSFYRGTSTYVSSQSWQREGASLIKSYEAEDAGLFLIAVRAYEGEGAGDYRLTARCLGGPCAGELPPPGSELSAGQVADCIGQARRCSFARLPRYDGAVGAARAQILMQECLDEAALEDGSSCSAACQWVNSDDDDDTAASVCTPIVMALPYYADASPACVSTLDSCMGQCYDAAGYGSSSYYDDQLGYTTEAVCFSGGLNGNCDTYARSHEVCGGSVLADSAAECDELCQSTSGAFIDDIQDICGRDAGCDDYCEVDIEAASARCGGYTTENRRCITDILDETGAYICTDRVEDDL